MFKKLLTRKLNGFNGLNHALLSILFMLVFMIIPLEPFQLTFAQLKNNILLFIICLVVLAGGALFPDLDNDSSSAGYTLGPLGSIMTVFMKSTSSVVWNIYHFKGDQRPTTQHRYLWHAPLIWVGLLALFYFGLPSGNFTIFTNLSNSIQTGNFGYFVQTNATLVLFIILTFMAVLVGSNMVIYSITTIFDLPYLIKYILPSLVLIYIFTTNYTNLRIIGISFATGALLHCIEDAFCDTGLPSLIFPIPQFWRNKVWGRIKLLPITFQTQSKFTQKVVSVLSGVLIVAMLIVVFK